MTCEKKDKPKPKVYSMQEYAVQYQFYIERQRELHRIKQAQLKNKGKNDG